MKQILPQERRDSHSLFPPQPLLLLMAPHIAGLLPATIERRQPEISPFIYSDPRLAELSTNQRERIYVAARTLLDVAVAHALGGLNDHALNSALALFRRAVTGQPGRAMNPAQYNAEMDAPLLEWAMATSRRRANPSPEVRHA